jgi:hypothetical protein
MDEDNKRNNQQEINKDGRLKYLSQVTNRSFNHIIKTLVQLKDYIQVL